MVCGLFNASLGSSTCLVLFQSFFISFRLTSLRLCHLLVFVRIVSPLFSLMFFFAVYD